ncbi:hypothetical protein DE146DRAFT_639834 [Phaeosphaeria sp. MPI-PUGE-AT-0046c]|nr:hypothetical protein DE146DRAFT_639834 [Phaeosphaeria sp. MPI-PUGE-AT-0046c]
MAPTICPEPLATPLSYYESQRLIRQLQETNQALLDVIQSLENKKSLWRCIYSHTKRFLHSYANWLRALPNLVATFLWLSMLLYFTAWYLTLPQNDKGQHPQICKSFSLWPYISCIGERRPAAFRAVCTAMALLITFSFLTLCRLSNQIQHGRWLRATAAFFAVVSSCALITLSFLPVDQAPKAHLVATSTQIFAMGNTKFFDWLSNSRVRRGFRTRVGSHRRVRALEVSRWLKTCVAAFAAVPAMATCMGVYYCTDIGVVNDSTSTCNKVVALSAVAEWVLSIGWVAYMSTIAYDLYHIDFIVKLWRLVDTLNAKDDSNLGDGRDQMSEDSSVVPTSVFLSHL